MLSIKTFTFNPFQENTYVVYNSGEAMIFDPGCYEPEETQTLYQWVTEKGLTVKTIINTHCHIDHVLGNDFCKRTFKAPLHIPELEKNVLAAVQSYAANYGFQRYQAAEVDVFLNESSILTIGEIKLKSMFIPGHAPGHLIFYNEAEGICIGGDVLFRGSIGRTDLPGGDHDTLLRNIKEKVFSLPEDMTVYPGHGPTTTIGFEKLNNPFVGANAS